MRDHRIVEAGRDHWRPFSPTSPIKKSPQSPHELSACQTANILSSHLCVGVRCFGAAQPAAASLLRCVMLQSPGAFFFTLSCLSSFKIVKFASKTVPQSCYESLVLNLERGTERIRCKHGLSPASVDSYFCTLAMNRSGLISSVKDAAKGEMTLQCLLWLQHAASQTQR